MFRRVSTLSDSASYFQTFATTVYALTGVVGFLMFGNDVNDEVTRLSLSPFHLSDV
jgi:hypothetical protein